MDDRSGNTSVSPSKSSNPQRANRRANRRASPAQHRATKCRVHVLSPLIRGMARTHTHLAAVSTLEDALRHALQRAPLVLFHITLVAVEQQPCILLFSV
jgi:hypothetical protein